MQPIYILLIVLGVLLLLGVGVYNSLILKRNRVKNAWADIDVQLKRRYDLIPNLVSTVKGAANFESSTLEKVIQARNSAMSAHDSGDKDKIAETETQLTGALKQVFALAENYPDLKATANFGSLQSELTDTEDKIQAARRFYNATVTDFNTAIQMFPTNILAGLFGFKEEEMFKLSDSEAAAKNPVEVKF
ncbi:MAG: LemA family protein [Candidatus Pacebacteria bacterium]|nr:LemA family protein [Candidatus Paceibacterota bacterium]